MPVLRTTQRAGSENRETPVKNKSSYNFSCFAGLFLKLVQFLIQAQLREPSRGDRAVRSNGSCYATERKIHKTTSPAGCPQLVEIQHQQQREKATTRPCRAAPVQLVKTACTAIAPREFYSLLGERMFSWSVTPCRLGTQLHMLFA